MSFSFSTNLNALSALYNLNNVSNAVSTSLQRLSSGLRINSPADDPTGFVVSNNLQVQVDSLNVAVTNNQNSINLIKTATSALSQITTLVSTIRASALDAVANAISNPTQAQVDQTNIQSALQSISNIAATTQYGNKNLLDGSAGVSAAVTNGTLLGGINIGGAFGGGVTQSGNVTITVTQAASYAQAYNATAATYTSVNASIATVNGGTSGSGGTVILNGQTITVTGSDTVQTLLNKINTLTSTTGVSAAFSAANGSGSIVLTQQTQGANYRINESESAALIAGTTGTAVVGQNALVTVTAPTLLGGTVTSASVSFVGGRGTTDSGLRVTDTYGNSILLTAGGGNSTSVVNQAVGNLSANSLQFQVGANVGQTANATLPNAFPSSLGTSSVPGQNLSTINVTTLTGANNAVLIATEAANAINQFQAQLGSFQTNVLQSTQNVLQSTVQNLTASIAGIKNVNVAQESANLTNLQLIQQAGISVLSTANNLPALYLKLLP